MIALAQRDLLELYFRKETNGFSSSFECPV